MSNYGKVDILWYDVAWPLDAKGWESEQMNRMVRKLQPDIIINNRIENPGRFRYARTTHRGFRRTSLGILHDLER